MNGSARRVQLAALAKAIGWVSVNDGDPEDKGRQIGARQRVAWQVSDTQMVSTARLVFAVARGASVSHVGYHSAEAGGTAFGSRPLPEPQPFRTTGTYTIEAGDIVEALADG